MSTISSAAVSPLAYKKIVLHSAKYPTARVLGLLLAETTTTTSQTLTIVDSIPLSHHWTSLSPIAEVALSLATSYASTRNLSLVGLYEAPELLSEKTPSQQANKLAEKIAALASRESLLLLVDNEALLGKEKQPLSGWAVAAGVKGDGKAKALAASGVVVDQDGAKDIESALRNDAWEKVVDFDGKYIRHIQRWLRRH